MFVKFFIVIKIIFVFVKGVNDTPLHYSLFTIHYSLIYGIYADIIVPHGPASPFMFSYRIQKNTSFPLSPAKSKRWFLRRVNTECGRSSPVRGRSVILNLSLSDGVPIMP